MGAGTLRAGVRRRLMVLSTVVTGIALVAATAGGIAVLREALLRSAHTTLGSGVGQILDGLEGPEREWTPPRKTDLAQLIGPDGRVVRGCGAPDSDCGPPAYAPLTPAPGELVETTDGGMRLMARGIRLDGADHVVVVGMSAEPIQVAVRTSVLLALVAIPLLLALVAFASHRLAGRALAPVEGIRERVAAIGGGGDLGRRVPEPDGDDEIARLATTMNAMLARLEAAQRTQRRFVADAGHELRSPLTTLTGIVELARRDGGRIPPEALSSAEGELGRIRLLVDDLLLLARADESGLGLRREEVDLDDVLEGERVRLRSTGAAEGVHVAALLEPVKVVGDRDALARLARNLADNAVRHARTGVELEVRAEDDGWAVITVRDDGPGIPPEDRERVFERFVRLDSGRGRASGGTGLGLSIVAAIAREHGGSAAAGEGPRGGAAFTVRLPRG
ncbi:HAMP domain-containing sensor histidine kinase [Nocardiopsis sp. RSe5-2]|uniref:histidine kinase n=1 Tax=Nocardiopsis endophytica TaxID=3018445 RepID=A0ABT4U3T4_9ACTN|nr:HAMP domain-containing sensor histidine kinase [Nocardiopsis endophytica]MDA2811614.1 HAMP domain-containing sensor histidine kinase [Nocardiopsis endophytica]